jgi:hypothetical protein
MTWMKMSHCMFHPIPTSHEDVMPHNSDDMDDDVKVVANAVDTL